MPLAESVRGAANNGLHCQGTHCTMMSTARQLVTDRARPPARSPERTRDSRRAHIRDREPRCTRTARSSVTGGGGDARALAT